MVATVNPCGFAMLPAYLGYFLGLEGQDRDVQASVSRSLGVGLSVSAGFLVVFGLAGLAIYHLQASIYEWVPVGDDRDRGRRWPSSASPCCAGFEPVVALPKMQRGGRTTGGGSMFVFGISYADRVDLVRAAAVHRRGGRHVPPREPRCRAWPCSSPTRSG